MLDTVPAKPLPVRDGPPAARPAASCSAISERRACNSEGPPDRWKSPTNAMDVCQEWGGRPPATQRYAWLQRQVLHMPHPAPTLTALQTIARLPCPAPTQPCSRSLCAPPFRRSLFARTRARARTHARTHTHPSPRLTSSGVMAFMTSFSPSFRLRSTWQARRQAQAGEGSCRCCFCGGGGWHERERRQQRRTILAPQARPVQLSALTGLPPLAADLPTPSPFPPTRT